VKGHLSYKQETGLCCCLDLYQERFDGKIECKVKQQQSLQI
jgi:hypothetical protein